MAKQEVIDDICLRLGLDRVLLGPGSTEPASLLRDLARSLSVPGIDELSSKVSIAEKVIKHLGEPFVKESMVSPPNTITKYAFDVILRGLSKRSRESGSDFQVDITPKVTSYELYRNFTYNHWFAVGEFIDNSITSAMRHWDALEKVHGDFVLRVDINFDEKNGRIIIDDNAGGITYEELHSALIAGEEPADKRYLSQFGMGMKLATFWWGRQLEVITSPLGDENSYVTTIDLDHIKVTGETTVDVRRARRKQLSGTRIIISKVYDEKWPKGKSLVKLKSLLRSMYRIYVSNEDRKIEIFFNGEKLVYTPPAILREPFWPSNSGPGSGPELEWQEDFTFTTPKGRNIKGSFGILATTSRDINGFYLHYKGKGMGGIGYSDEGDDQFSRADLRDGRDFYRPASIFGQEGSYRYIRFTGEFDISDFGKTSSTDSVTWEPEEEEAFLVAVEKAMKRSDFNFWSMAQNYQPRKWAKTRAAEIEETDFTPVQMADLGLSLFRGWSSDAHGHDDQASAYVSKIDQVPLVEFQKVDFATIPDREGHEHKIIIQAIEDPSLDLFSMIPGSSTSEHILKLNTGHPLIRSFQWGNQYVRDAVLSLVILMALPEVFLDLRVSARAFREKINELADDLRIER